MGIDPGDQLLLDITLITAPVNVGTDWNGNPFYQVNNTQITGTVSFENRVLFQINGTPNLKYNPTTSVLEPDWTDGDGISFGGTSNVPTGRGASYTGDQGYFYARLPSVGEGAALTLDWSHWEYRGITYRAYFDGGTNNCSAIGNFCEPSFLYDLAASATPATSEVPVPAAAWLMVSGLLGVVGAGRRQKNRSAV